MANVQLIQIVDKNDQPVRAASRQEAWKQGLFHRIVSVLVENASGQLLLQKRSPGVVISPGAWDSSASGHVDHGETYEQAAIRELAEEIGLKNASLKEIAYWQSSEVVDDKIFNRFTKLYHAKVRDPIFALQESEVSHVQWFAIAEIEQMLKANQKAVTGGLIEDIKYITRANHH